jgi:hypothetical protein
VPPPATVGNAQPYLNALIGSHCLVIFAAGPPQVEAAYASAARSTQVPFYVIGGGPAPATVANVTGIDAPTSAEVSAKAHAIVVEVGRRNPSQ